MNNPQQIETFTSKFHITYYFSHTYGYHLGMIDCFSETAMEFDDFFDAIDIANHWTLWIYGMDDGKDL
jgi:hypothetical protein